VRPQRCLDLRVPFGHCDQRQGLTVSWRVDVRSSRDESIDNRGVVSTARPAMDRPERRPAERCAEVDGIAALDRHAPASEDRLNHLDVAHPARGVKSSAAINATGSFIKTKAEHEARSLAPPVEDGVGQP
jgi:hypothetical protein